MERRKNFFRKFFSSLPEAISQQNVVFTQQLIFTFIFFLNRNSILHLIFLPEFLVYSSFPPSLRPSIRDRRRESSRSSAKKEKNFFLFSQLSFSEAGRDGAKHLDRDCRGGSVIYTEGKINQVLQPFVSIVSVFHSESNFVRLLPIGGQPETEAASSYTKISIQLRMETYNIRMLTGKFLMTASISESSFFL